MYAVRCEVSDYDQDLDELQHPSFYGKWCTREYTRCWERERELRIIADQVWVKTHDVHSLVYRNIMHKYDLAVRMLLDAYRAFEKRWWVNFKVRARIEGVIQRNRQERERMNKQ